MKLEFPLTEFITAFDVLSEIPRYRKTLNHFEKGGFKTFNLPNETVHDIEKLNNLIDSVDKMADILEIINPQELKQIKEAANNLAIKPYTLSKSDSKKLNYFLDLLEEHYLQDLEKLHLIEKELSNLPTNLTKQAEVESQEIIREIKEYQDRSNKEILKDFIHTQDKGRYVSEIHHILTSRWGEGFSRSSILKHVRELEEEGYLTTFGGKEEQGIRERWVYPNMREMGGTVSNKKERLLEGIITDDITNYFKAINPSTFILNVFEFDLLDVDKKIYLIAKENLPKEEEIKSIGIFYSHHLGEVIEEKFGYKIKQEYHKFNKEPSLLAFLVRKDSENLWVDKDSKRAKEIIHI